MFPSRYLRQNDVIAVDAHEPIDASDETYQEQIQRRDSATFGQLRMKIDGDELGENGGCAQQVADPDHWKL